MIIYSIDSLTHNVHSSLLISSILQIVHLNCNIVMSKSTNAQTNAIKHKLMEYIM